MYDEGMTCDDIPELLADWLERAYCDAEDRLSLLAVPAFTTASLPVLASSPAAWLN
jgi:hypothetical protein